MENQQAIILIVDDNPNNIKVLFEVLEQANFCVLIAKNGESALEKVAAVTPDLILLDLNLPKKSGVEVLEEIKTDINLKLIPVVILSTSAAPEDIIKSYSLHANCYITKPVDFVQFTKVVRLIEEFWLSVVQLPVIY